MFQPENGFPILSWYDDKADTKLFEIMPVLKAMAQVPDVRPVIQECTTKDNKFINEKAIKMCENIMQ
jgi:TFIIF-interacting CTD phosphatase-like protein